jgi:hypothetical protein
MSFAVRANLTMDHLMALKDLIVHLDQAESARECLRLAANLAHRHGCRLTAIYVRKSNDTQKWLGRTAELASAGVKEFDEIHEQVRLSIENGAARLQSELEASQREQGLEVAWRSVDGIASKVVPQHARFADLCVVAHRVHTTDNLSEKLQFLSGRPVGFVPPDVGAKVLGIMVQEAPARSPGGSGGRPVRLRRGIPAGRRRCGSWRSTDRDRPHLRIPILSFLMGWRVATTRMFISGELKASVEIGRALERPVAHSIKGPPA